MGSGLCARSWDIPPRGRGCAQALVGGREGVSGQGALGPEEVSPSTLGRGPGGFCGRMGQPLESVWTLPQPGLT